MRRVVLLLAFAAVCLTAEPDPEAILARVRERMIGELQRIANYTCIQTVSREYFRPNLARSPENCDALYASKASGGHTLHPWSIDHLRLDVAVTPKREIYSWAGAEKFDERDLPGIVGGGPISTGTFSGFLSSIFGGHDAIFTFGGTTKRDGRELLQFAYRVPLERSQYRMRTIAGGWVVSAYQGAILVDPETADLLRLTIVTAELPPETGSCEANMEMEYQRVVIGESEVLLPASTRQRFVLRNGVESENTTIFSACRAYRGESTVRFVAADDASPAATGSAARSAEPLPDNLPVTMELAAPLDTWAASGGDRISLRLTKPIVDSVKRVLVPAGALVDARLIRVQRYFSKPAQVTIVMQPEALDAGVRQPIALFPNVPEPTFSVQGFGANDVPRGSRSATLNFTGEHVIVPKGYRTSWYTAQQ
jgi:hypothetical protein